MSGRIVVVQGGQWGSEAKGLITAKLVNTLKADICVRTGTVNAGHTIYYKGKPYAMQQLPVGWVRPGCLLVLGAGAYIHPEILLREIAWVREATGEDVRERLIIDHRAGIHLPYHTDRSASSGRHHTMGATGKGCSEAVIDKIHGRGEPGSLGLFFDYARDARGAYLGSFAFADCSSLLNKAYDRGEVIVIEGTQGTMLDLHLGPWPYTTHKQCQAANWLAECGLSPSLPIEVVMVMRTYPIRVAGNSGPMPGEISWLQFANGINGKLAAKGCPQYVTDAHLTLWDQAVRRALCHYPECPQRDPATWSQREKEANREAASEVHAIAWADLDLETRTVLGLLFEKTTVTHKLRRIATMDPITTAQAVTLNRPTYVALTFMNYLFPHMWGTTRVSFGYFTEKVREEVYRWLRDFEKQYGVQIKLVSFGPLEEHTWELYENEAAQ